MPDTWTGALVGKMHINEVTNRDIATELGVTASYVSMVLNSIRTPPNAEKRFNDAVDAIIQRRKSRKRGN